MSGCGFQTDQYQLLDFGAGRKLERFGNWIIDRPSPRQNGHPNRSPNYGKKHI